MLLIHGEKDKTVPIQQSELMFNSLQQAGVSSHFHTVLGDEHLGCTGPKVIALVKDFFDMHLMSKPLRNEALNRPTSKSAAVTVPTSLGTAEPR